MTQSYSTPLCPLSPPRTSSPSGRVADTRCVASLRRMQPVINDAAHQTPKKNMEHGALSAYLGVKPTKGSYDDILKEYNGESNSIPAQRSLIRRATAGA